MHDEREHPHNIRAETIPGKKEKSLSGALIGPNTRETIRWVRLAGAVSLLSQTQTQQERASAEAPREEKKEACAAPAKKPRSDPRQERRRGSLPAWNNC